MRRLLSALAILSICAAVVGGVPSPAAASTSASVSGAGSGVWQTVWRDDFNGPAGQGVNTEFWKYDLGQGVWGTGEIETMTNSTANVHLDGHGSLDITALGQGQNWTSGRIQTKSSGFGAPAGGEMAVTASLQQPNPTGGLGYWPAFWMLGPGSWPRTGEVDILEDVNALSEHSSTVHCGNLTHHNPDGTLGPCHEFTGLSSGLLPCEGCQTGYHTYTAVIDRRHADKEEIRWYLDGRETFQVNEDQVPAGTWTQAFHHGMSIIFDLAMGGSYPNAICNCTSPDSTTTSGGTMSIRYVAVSEREP